jgi:hypothetical protein
VPRTFDDLTGRVFGRLLVLEFDHFDRYRISYYKVRCECGAEKVVQRPNLISGGTVSCNCWRIENSRAQCGEKSPSYRHGKACGDRKIYQKTYEKWAWANQIRKRKVAVAVGEETKMAPTRHNGTCCVYDAFSGTERCMRPVTARGRCSAHYFALLESTQGLSRSQRDAELKPKELPHREPWEYLGNEEALFAMQASSKGEN